MSGFFSLIAQQQPVHILTAILRKGAVPHALLFSGIGGVGKQKAALAFAMALNCTADGAHGIGSRSFDDSASSDSALQPEALPCGVCRSCRRIESGSHPDIISVKPSGSFIRIDQIRELRRVLTMKPYEADYRIAVISDAHRMNAEAGNALLKLLEEPPDRTVLILTAEAIADLLPTIVSRCRHIRFSPIPVPQLAEILIRTHGMDSESARRLAALSGGSLTKAEHLARDNWTRRRQWLLRVFFGLVLQSGGLWELRRHFAAAAVLFPDKEVALDSLEILKTIYRDVLVFKYQPENLMNTDLGERIVETADRIGDEETMAAVSAIEDTRNRICANANVRLALETLFLSLAKFQEMN